MNFNYDAKVSPPPTRSQKCIFTSCSDKTSPNNSLKQSTSTLGLPTGLAGVSVWC